VVVLRRGTARRLVLAVTVVTGTSLLSVTGGLDVGVLYPSSRND
jgi:hypothetical protein